MNGQKSQAVRHALLDGIVAETEAGTNFTVRQLVDYPHQEGPPARLRQFRYRKGKPVQLLAVRRLPLGRRLVGGQLEG
jgi:hypothetical protein